jgi:hypothetical protein
VGEPRRTVIVAARRAGKRGAVCGGEGAAYDCHGEMEDYAPQHWSDHARTPSQQRRRRPLQAPTTGRATHQPPAAALRLPTPSGVALGDSSAAERESGKKEPLRLDPQVGFAAVVKQGQGKASEVAPEKPEKIWPKGQKMDLHRWICRMTSSLVCCCCGARAAADGRHARAP